AAGNARTKKQLLRTPKWHVPIPATQQLFYSVTPSGLPARPKLSNTLDVKGWQHNQFRRRGCAFFKTVSYLSQ
ncbi:MAG: hypothetical protein ACR2OL_06245, partial [Anderseniella sp.]